jgi:hypothetical protein
MVEKTGQGDEDDRSNFVGARRAVPRWVLKIQMHTDLKIGGSYKLKAGSKDLFFLPYGSVAGVRGRLPKANIAAYLRWKG